MKPLVALASLLLVAACTPPAPSTTTDDSPAPIGSAAQSAAAVASPGASAPSTIPPTAAPTLDATSTPTTEPTIEPTAEPTAEPTQATRGCPTDDVLTVSQYLAAPLRCFGSDRIRIEGWLDTPPPVGFEPPLIRPTWLAYPPDGTLFFTLFSKPPTPPDHVCGDCPGFFLHLKPSSTIVLDGPGRWVIATGHRRDPASERCFFDEPDDWIGEEPDDANARETCRLQFVLTGLKDAPAP